MTKITLSVPPDHTPDEEAALVARVAASFAASGVEDVHIETTRPEEVDYAAVGERTERSSRWSS